MSQDDLAKIYRTIRIKLVTTTGHLRTIKLWIKDLGGTGPSGQSYSDYLSEKPIQKTMMESRP